MAADLTYYTIDDLRLGQRRSDGPGWRLSEFGLRSDAFRHYRSLDAEKVKVLGVTNGKQAAQKKFRLINVAGSNSPIRWIYVSGVGWLSPSEFKKRYFPPKNGGFNYPLVMKYRVDAVNRTGRILLLEIAPRDFERMAGED